jgi:hypothetical protein
LRVILADARISRRRALQAPRRASVIGRFTRGPRIASSKARRARGRFRGGWEHLKKAKR